MWSPNELVQLILKHVEASGPQMYDRGVIRPHASRCGREVPRPSRPMGADAPRGMAFFRKRD